MSHAYRTPQSFTSEASFRCSACGASLPFDVRVGQVRCFACGLDQHTLRASMWDLAARRLELEGYDSGDHQELDLFAAHLGAPDGAREVRFRADGLPLRAWLEINSGSLTGIEMPALVEGMVPMRLARETSANRRAKASGLAREVQLGDVSLDDRMYIDSPASDDQVRLALAPPAVREAVTMLLLRREWIEITTSSIRLGPDRDTPECFKLATMLPQVTALRALAGAPRPTSVALPALPARAALANWVADATVFLGVPSAFVSFAWFLPTPMSSVFLQALGLGLAAWVVLGWPLRKAVAGRSSSPSHLGRLRMKSLLGLPAVALTSLLLVDASHSRRVTVQGRVAAVTAVEDDRETHHVEVRLDNGLELSFSVRGRLPVVHRPVTATVRRGLLGIWYAAHLDDIP